MKNSNIMNILSVLLVPIILCQGLALGTGASSNSLQYGTSSVLGYSAGIGERICETMEDFLVEIDKDNGGIIRLQGEEEFILQGNVDIEVTRPITVYLPETGIYIEESLNISGPVTFKGERCFSLYDSAELFLYNGVQVCAKSVYGAIAIYLSGCNNISADSTVSILSEGDSAVSIYNEDGSNFDFRYTNIIAVGNDACAIYNLADSIFLDKVNIKAEGEGSSAVKSTGEVLLSQVCTSGYIEAFLVYSVLSSLSPIPENTITLKAEPDQLLQTKVVYQDLAYGSEPPDFPDSVHLPYFYKYPDSPFEFLVDVDFTADWNLNNLDYSTPGSYMVSAVLTPVGDISKISIAKIEYEIIVMPKNSLALGGDWGMGQYSVVECLAPADSAKEILFWVYEETGWREITKTGNAVYAEKWEIGQHDYFEYAKYPLFQITGLNEDEYYWVVAQIIGGPMEGFSNLWCMYTGTQKGGDRTGTDRFGAKPDALPNIEQAEDAAVAKAEKNNSYTGSNSIDLTPVSPLPAKHSNSKQKQSENKNIKEKTETVITTPRAEVKANNSEDIILVEELLSPKEWEDENTVAINGRRLLALLVSGDNITFIKHGVRVVINPEDLANIEIFEDRLLIVTILPKGDSYSVTFYIDSTELDLPYTLLLPNEEPSTGDQMDIVKRVSIQAETADIIDEKTSSYTWIVAVCLSIVLAFCAYSIVRKRLLRK